MFSFESFQSDQHFHIRFNWIQWNNIIRRNIYFCSGFSKIDAAASSAASLLSFSTLHTTQGTHWYRCTVEDVSYILEWQSDPQEYLDILAGSWVVTLSFQQGGSSDLRGQWLSLSTVESPNHSGPESQSTRNCTRPAPRNQWSSRLGSRVIRPSSRWSSHKRLVLVTRSSTGSRWSTKIRVRALGGAPSLLSWNDKVSTQLDYRQEYQQSEHSAPARISIFLPVTEWSLWLLLVYPLYSTVSSSENRTRFFPYWSLVGRILFIRRS
jgi:hypothetical protein